MSISLDYDAMARMRRHDSEEFSIKDVDMTLFIERLSAQSDPLSKFLWQSLLKDDQTVVSNYQASAPDATNAHDILLRAINRIMAGPCIYTFERFQGVSLHGDTRNFLLMHTMESGRPDDPHLNRLLLQDAYPLELTRNLEPGETAIKIGVPIVVTLSFTNISTNSSTNDTAYMLTTPAGAEFEGGYSFSVISPSGKRISPKSISYSGKTVHTGLVPSQMLTFALHLSDICDFDEVGSYTIIVTRRMHNYSGEYSYFTVVSNPFTITIVPDK
jgi:hypothetical protein